MTTHPLSVFQVVGLAADHKDANSSAALCHEEAVKALADGRAVAAARWAVRSLEHSVGVFHPDWKAATAEFPTASAHAVQS